MAVTLGMDKDRIKLFTQDTKHFSDWHQNFAEDPNKYAQDADVCFATSVIGAGFSIDVHFESYVAFLFNHILTNKEESQFIARVRYFIEAKNHLPDELRRSLIFIAR